MKTLVVFYSLQGNTRLIAENIAQAVNADILVLKPKTDISPKGFIKYVWGGAAATMKTKPELLPWDTNIQKYDLIFIGTPVWAWTYAPALNTLFSTGSLSGKKTALFCCHGGGKGGIFAKMEKALTGNQVLGKIDFQDPLTNNTAINVGKAKEWAKEISDKVRG
jgi:flavodoxin